MIVRVLGVNDLVNKGIHFVLVFNVVVGDTNNRFNVLDFILHFLHNMLSVEFGSVTFLLEFMGFFYAIGFPSMFVNVFSAKISLSMGGEFLFLSRLRQRSMTHERRPWRKTGNIKTG